MRKSVAGLFISPDGVVEAPQQWQAPMCWPQRTAARVHRGSSVAMEERFDREAAGCQGRRWAADLLFGQHTSSPVDSGPTATCGTP